MQVYRQGLHISPRVREMCVANPWHDQATALNSNFQPAESLRRVPDRIIGAVQAVEPLRVILLVQAFRPHEQMQVSQGAMSLDGLRIGAGSLSSGGRVRMCAQRGGTRGGIRLRRRGCSPLLLLDR